MTTERKRKIAVAVLLAGAVLLSACALITFDNKARQQKVMIVFRHMPKTIRLGDTFDPKAYVTVTDQAGKKQPLSKLTVKGRVNPEVTGTYKLSFEYKNGSQRTAAAKQVEVVYERTEPVAFKKEIINKASMERGTTQVHQKGANGLARVRYKAKRLNGHIQLGKVLLKETVKKPKPQIVYSGSKIPRQYRMNVAVVRQLPELPAGCEITAVTMMLRYHGAKVSKLSLADEMPRAVNNDPNTGFVGSPYSRSGVTIYPPALMDLVAKYAGHSVNLTGASVERLKDYLSRNHPVVVWGTYDGFLIHAITLTGYTEGGFYYNDPWTGTKRWMTQAQMLEHWQALDRRALSF